VELDASDGEINPQIKNNKGEIKMSKETVAKEWFKKNKVFIAKCNDIQKQLSELVKEGETLAPKGYEVTLLPNTVEAGLTEMEIIVE
jgi:superoxide dismutase